ncbi:protein-(glutamine-N5) methyltransferase, release factor-specific [Pasteurellaceae bacterium Macca]|nr:protein-(glutamine-N5) methyltransferase, release factor-specific [Pasteurellaceae bacterium Macca]
MANGESRVPQSYTQWLAFAEKALQQTQDDPYLNAKLDANVLLQRVTNRSKSAIFAFGETLLSEVELAQLDELLTRRLQGEPLAYILGEKEFWSLPLSVSPATLIPRPDTERLVELALDVVNQATDSGKSWHILDLGTGTGAIALALGNELGDRCRILGVDKQPQAVALAEHNRQKLGISHVRFCQSDWFSALQGERFDVIVSNPPYIDAQDENLSRGDVRFEPMSALVAENHGLGDLTTIIQQAPQFLHHGGVLLLEHGWQQACDVQAIFQQNQWDNIQTVKDYGGHDRVTMAQWKKNS